MEKMIVKRYMKILLTMLLPVFLCTSCFSLVESSNTISSNLNKLDPIELENAVINQLKIDENTIYIRTSQESPNHLNETVVVIGEVEYDNSENRGGDDYGLTSHILIVDAVTGRIKYHYSESSKNNGWQSDAIFIAQIYIDTKNYNLNTTEVAFGVKADFRSSSQPNPNDYTELSLFIKEGDSLKKVLDNFIIDDYSGEINVNMNACYADVKREKNELTVLESGTNGYYDIQVKNTVVKSIYELDTAGACEPIEKSRVEKTLILKHNKTKYKI